MAADRLGILLISGGHERAHYAFVLASGAAAIGRQVVLFATNQGCQALLADLGVFGPEDDSVMARGVAGLVELRAAAAELGVRMIACEAGLRLAGITADLAQNVEIAGVVTFLEATHGAQVISL
jgi:peroxiredoxin family protein